MSSFSATLEPATLPLRAPSERTRFTLLTALCLFSAVLGRLCFLRRPFDSDATMFIYMGKMVSDGGRMCHDLIDNKFPTVGLMTSILYRSLGTCWTAYVLLQLVMSLATAASLGRTARRIAGNRAAQATMLFAVVFLNFTTVVFGGFQLETVQVLFTSLAAAAGLEMLFTDNLADAFTAGLCAGFGMMFKPTALAILVALTIALFIRRRGWILNMLAMGAGLAIPLAAAFSYLWAADLLRDMPELYRQISTYARETVFDSVQVMKPIIALALLGFPILVRGFVFRRHRTQSVMWPKTSVTFFLLIWLAVETAGVIMQRRMYAYHFVPMIPPAALLFGTIPRANRTVSLAAALLPIMLLNFTQAWVVISHPSQVDGRLRLSDYLATHTKTGDAVWMDSWPRLLLETPLRAASGVPFTFLFTNYDNAGLDYSNTIIHNFERTRPAYIILPTPLQRFVHIQIATIVELDQRPLRRKNYLAGWKQIESYTLEHYTLETTIGTDAVYRRK